MRDNDRHEFEYRDTEATANEFDGVCYTGICVVALLAVVISLIIFAVVG